jgi:penicillin-binding protein 2
VVDADGDVVKRIRPKKASRVKVSARDLRYIDSALQGTSRTGTMAWRLIDFPLDKVRIRSKTGSAEVYGKQSTSWVASYDKRYVVVMMVSQGGTGSGTSGPAIRKIWETLYGIDGMRVRTDAAALPGARPPKGLPVFAPDGEILPPPPAQKSAREERR